MAYVVKLTNGIEVKEAPLGFSWTTLFFGGFPALFRGDILIGVAMIVANFFTWGLAGIIFSFFYNGIYAKSLLAKGYKVCDLGVMTEKGVKETLGLVSLPMVDGAVK
jgi:hypothetical protein